MTAARNTTATWTDSSGPPTASLRWVGRAVPVGRVWGSAGAGPEPWGVSYEAEEQRRRTPNGGVASVTRTGHADADTESDEGRQPGSKPGAGMVRAFSAPH